MSARSLRDLLEQEVQELYSVETQILDAFPDIIERVADEGLRQTLEEHRRITMDQRRRLEAMAPQLGIELDIVTSRGMAGILSEERATIASARDEAVRDAVIVSSAQKVEHYEIAGYRSALFHALVLGEEDIASLLDRTLQEEREAGRALSGIAESRVNEGAAAD